MRQRIVLFQAAALTLFLLLLGPGAWADQLTVYLYPSPQGVHWGSPNTLVRSAVTGELVNDDELINIHSIGHANFDLQCGSTRIFTGQTNSDQAEMTSKIMDQGYGLGMLLTNYKGRWETQNEIETDLPVRYKRGSVAFMEFQIRPEACQRAAQYLRQYKALGYDQIYGGLQSRARHREGAGCIGFTQSVMEVAGVFTSELRSYWAHTVNIPKSLVGGPITGHHVSIVDLLMSPAGFQWNSTAKDSVVLNFWDPFQAYWWVRYANQGKGALSGMSFQPAKRGNALGVTINALKVPVPRDAFWVANP